MSGAQLRPGTLLLLAGTGGRADRLRIALTAVGAASGTLGLLAAATVAATGSTDGPYTSDVLNQPGLHPGVVIALLLLCVPLLLLVGQCSRIGAPARDRRLAAYRMAGGTPRDVVLIAAAETGLAAALGALLGLAIYLVGRVPLDSWRATGATVQRNDGYSRIREPVAEAVRVLPTDVLPPWPVLVLLTALIPVGATVAASIALRRVALSPFGVVSATTTRPPRVVPALLFVGGTAGLLGWDRLVRAFALDSVFATFAVALALFLTAAAGLILGSAAVTAWLGRLLAPRVRRPALLLAARRMIAAPWTASRASTAVLLAVMIGGMVQGARANVLLATDPGDRFYAETFTLINLVLGVAVALAAAGLLVVTAEGVVVRRRTLAALTAAGTPRGVLARSVLAETLLPLLPGVLLAGAAGVLAARGVLGTEVILPTVSGPGDEEPVPVTVGVPVPWGDLALLTGGTLLVTALVTGLALLFLRRSTDVTELRAAA